MTKGLESRTAPQPARQGGALTVPHVDAGPWANTSLTGDGQLLLGATDTQDAEKAESHAHNQTSWPELPSSRQG